MLASQNLQELHSHLQGFWAVMMLCHLGSYRQDMVVDNSPFLVEGAGQAVCIWAQMTLCLLAALARSDQAGQA